MYSEVPLFVKSVDFSFFNIYLFQSRQRSHQERNEFSWSEILLSLHCWPIELGVMKFYSYKWWMPSTFQIELLQFLRL